MPGPPPKPAAVRRRDGNPGKRKIHDEPRIGAAVVLSDDFPAPAHLPDSVAEVWREIVPDLVEIGLVRAIDATVLEALCRFLVRARRADEILDAYYDQEHDFDVVTERGVKAHPALKVSRDSWAMVARLSGEYGMTAVGRLKVGAAVLKQRSLAEDLREALFGDDDAAIEG